MPDGLFGWRHRFEAWRRDSRSRDLDAVLDHEATMTDDRKPTRRELVERLKEAAHKLTRPGKIIPVLDPSRAGELLAEFQEVRAALSALAAAPKAEVRAWECDGCASLTYGRVEWHRKGGQACPGTLHALIREEDAT